MEAVASEHLRLNAVYWGLCCLELLSAPADTLDRCALRAWVLSCERDGSGGFGASPGHDAHVLPTLSALQVLALLGDPLLAEEAFGGRCAGWLQGLQRRDGSFAGSQAGGDAAEVDTRFTYAALAAATLLGRRHKLDCAAAADFLGSCANFDGGYGATPGGESHSGQVFTCLAALCLAQGEALRAPGKPGRLGAWLASRQLSCGGLNGRPEKAPDVCYSWWVLSSLAMLGRAHWLDGQLLARFILDAQDACKGGIADRRDDEADVYHTFFGVAALGLLGHPQVLEVDPVLALPLKTLQRLRLH